MTKWKKATVKAPDINAGRSFEVISQTLKNGLQVLLVENHTIPAISINATVLAGASRQ